MGADTYYRHGYFGDGIGIAMIDSGVSPVRGFDATNVKDGPDLSFESQAPYATGTDPSNNEPYEPNPDLAHNDTFGHGTHMAGIMVGHDDGSGSSGDGHVPYSWSDASKFTGVAPGAHVISLKVADSSGAVNVTQVIAAVDWVVQHRNDPGLNIRVLNLSYGFTAGDVANDDPLAYALQQAWNAGIVVVVAAGNAGHTTVAGSKLLMPAQNSHLLVVGAYDLNNTAGNPDDDLRADFTSSSAARARCRRSRRARAESPLGRLARRRRDQERLPRRVEPPQDLVLAVLRRRREVRARQRHLPGRGDGLGRGRVDAV